VGGGGRDGKNYGSIKAKLYIISFSSISKRSNIEKAHSISKSYNMFVKKKEKTLYSFRLHIFLISCSF
jgi:hypothetical protein